MPLSALPSPSGPSHHLFSSKTESVPTLDELVKLEAELQSLREEASLRINRADSGLLAINDFWKRAKEKTKELTRERHAKTKDGEKIKAIKIKRETTGKLCFDALQKDILTLCVRDTRYSRCRGLRPEIQ